MHIAGSLPQCNNKRAVERAMHDGRFNYATVQVTNHLRLTRPVLADNWNHTLAVRQIAVDRKVFILRGVASVSEHILSKAGWRIVCGRDGFSPVCFCSLQM